MHPAPLRPPPRGEKKAASFSTLHPRPEPARRRSSSRLLPLLGALAGCALAGCDPVESLFFHPTSRVYRTPADDGLVFEWVEFAAEDGTGLSGWFVPALQQPASGTVIQFHGNAENMTSHYSFVSWLPREGFNVFVFDYRGYGASEGRPSIAGVVNDSVAALQFLRRRPGVDPRTIIVLGQSLGGANAVLALGTHPHPRVAGAVFDSAFSSFKEVARDHGGSLGAGLVSAPQEPIDLIGKIAPTPVLLLHGTADGVVAHRHSERLLDAAGEPKELWSIPGAQHLEALSSRRHVHAPRLLEKFRQWVDAAVAPSAAAEGAPNRGERP